LPLIYNAVTQVMPATRVPKTEGEFPYRQALGREDRVILVIKAQGIKDVR
jgi:hypothetical protein